MNGKATSHLTAAADEECIRGRTGPRSEHAGAMPADHTAVKPGATPVFSAGSAQLPAFKPSSLRDMMKAKSHFVEQEN